MSTNTFPNDLQIPYSSAVQLCDYRSFSTAKRFEVNLQMNVISFVKEGTKKIYYSRVKTTVGKKEFVIIKTGTCLMSEIVSPATKTYRSILLFFTDETIIDFLKKRTSPEDYPELLIPVCKCEADDYIDNFVKSLEYISGLAPSLQEQLLPYKLDEFLTYTTALKGTAFLHCMIGNQDSRLVRFRNTIENNKLKKLSLDEIALLCNMSVSTFRRTFQREFKSSPIKWFQEKRLEHAAFLLSLKNEISDLHDIAGYNSPSNFIKAFKEKFGVTPRKYRKHKMNI